MATNSKGKRLVQDSGVPYREAPYRAGGPQGNLSSRKADLLSAGPGTGYLPGGQGQGKGSFVQSGYVHEVPHKAGPVAGFDDLEFGSNPRPRPRDTPVHATQTHVGSIVRFLDGHSEIHRDRPGLVAMMNDPHTHPDDREDIRQEIAQRDAVHLHKYW